MVYLTLLRQQQQRLPVALLLPLRQRQGFHLPDSFSPLSSLLGVQQLLEVLYQLVAEAVLTSPSRPLDQPQDFLQGVLQLPKPQSHHRTRPPPPHSSASF